MRRLNLADVGKRVEWELLPSLRHALTQSRRGPQPAWQDTIPSAFEMGDAFAVSESFDDEHEALPGLTVREVSEPEIFKIFFG